MTRERQAQAFADGYVAGVQDRAIGVLSEYAWYGQALDPVESYSYWYSRGYRQARTQR